jgi:hypothetical protein
MTDMLNTQGIETIKNRTQKQMAADRGGFSMFHRGPELEDDRDAPVVIKPLNSQFVDFADAARSYMNSRGYGPTTKAIDGDMVKTFCQVMGIEMVGFNTDSLLRNNEFFSETEWLAPVLVEHHYQAIGEGLFIRLDEGNRPLAMVRVSSDSSRNLTIQYNGEPAQAEVIYNLCKANFITAEKEDTQKARPKAAYVSFDGIDDDGDPDYNLKHIQREGELLPQYYPYIDGGVMQLLRDFIASDESVLILMGPPGTGKSSALMYAVNDLNLLPIYSTKTKLIAHPDFVSKLFCINDKYMENRSDSETSKRQRQFVERNALDAINRFQKKFTEAPVVAEKDEDEDSPSERIEDRIPMAVIEDADFLLQPRTSGNMVMGQLLNEVDGVGSHYARKLVFTTNLSSTDDIDPALLRDGRCFGVFDFRKLTVDEAVAARAAAGLPEFDVLPTTDIPLATALRKPRKRYIVGKDGKAGFGFNK